MNETALRQLLAAVAEGQSTVDDAVAALKTLPYESLPDVTIDHHRACVATSPKSSTPKASPSIRSSASSRA